MSEVPESAEQPTIGRIVHYVSRGSADGRFPSVCRAALVTEVPELLAEQPNSGPPGYVMAAHLCVVNPTGLFFDEDVAYGPIRDALLVGGTWHWPRRCDFQ